VSAANRLPPSEAAGALMNLCKIVGTLACCAAPREKRVLCCRANMLSGDGHSILVRGRGGRDICARDEGLEGNEGREAEKGLGRVAYHESTRSGLEPTVTTNR
jgi:hypothetical protein